MSLASTPSWLDQRIVAMVEAALQGAPSAPARQAVLLQAQILGRRVALPSGQRDARALLRGPRPPATLAELVARLGRPAKAPHPTRLLKQAPLQASGPSLSPGEVARRLGVSTKTVANWCDRGWLPCEVLPSGHRRIPERALLAHRQAQGHWDQADAAMRTGGFAPFGDDSAAFKALGLE